MKNSKLKDAVLSILFPKDGQLRMRKVVSRSNANPSFKHSSITENRPIHAESRNELNAILMADVDPENISICEQPSCITYCLDGVVYKHYPDLLIRTKDKSKFIEIKEAKEANEPEVKARTILMEKELKKYGYEYWVLVESDYKAEPRLTNSRFLHRKGYNEIEVTTKASALKALFQLDTTTLKVIKERLKSYSEKVIARLIIEGYLIINIDETWNDETLVVFAGGVK